MQNFLIEKLDWDCTTETFSVTPMFMTEDWKRDCPHKWAFRVWELIENKNGINRFKFVYEYTKRVKEF